MFPPDEYFAVLCSVVDSPAPFLSKHKNDMQMAACAKIFLFPSVDQLYMC